MSERTSKATSAVRKAWKNERQLVSEGKGTRDWTPEQQNDILTDGVAYDENHDVFRGHHMQSVELFPQYQGEPGNIQFLSVEEHLKAHDGWFRNLTNWYYNPVTGEKEPFEDDKYKPCKIIYLSDPVCPLKPIVDESNIIIGEEEEDSKKSQEEENKPAIVALDPQDKLEKPDEDKQKEERKETPPHNPNLVISTKPAQQRPQTNNPAKATISKHARAKKAKKVGFFGLVREKISDGIDAIRDWWDENGDIVKGVAKGIGKEVGKQAVNHAPEIIMGLAMSASHHSSDTDSDDKSRQRLKSENDTHGNNPPSSNDNTVPKAPTPNEPIIPDLDIPDEESSGSKRASPREHTVNDPGQHYWKGGKRVWIPKHPYRRGGNKNEETAADD